MLQVQTATGNGLLARQMDEAASGAAGGDDGAGAMLQHKNARSSTLQIPLKIRTLQKGVFLRN